MHTFDFAPIYRTTIGFDGMLSMLDEIVGMEQPAPNYPPYDIERTDKNAYQISLAVAGFGENDLSIEVENSALTIRGKRSPEDDKRSASLLHRGIASRTFRRSFQLAEHVVVRSASLDNGILAVDLIRVVPEAMKARAVPIKSRILLEPKLADEATNH